MYEGRKTAHVHLCPQCPVLNEQEATAGKTQRRYVSKDPPFLHSVMLCVGISNLSYRTDLLEVKKCFHCLRSTTGLNEGCTLLINNKNCFRLHEFLFVVRVNAEFL